MSTSPTENIELVASLPPEGASRKRQRRVPRQTPRSPNTHPSSGTVGVNEAPHSEVASHVVPGQRSVPEVDVGSEDYLDAEAVSEQGGMTRLLVSPPLSRFVQDVERTRMMGGSSLDHSRPSDASAVDAEKSYTEAMSVDPLSLGIRELVRSRQRPVNRPPTVDRRRRQADNRTGTAHWSPGSEETVAEASAKDIGLQIPAETAGPSPRLGGVSGAPATRVVLVPERLYESPAIVEDTQSDRLDRRIPGADTVVLAPQVRLDNRGNLVLDERSLVVTASHVADAHADAGQESVHPEQHSDHAGAGGGNASMASAASGPASVESDLQRRVQRHRRAIRAEQQRLLRTAITSEQRPAENENISVETHTGAPRRGAATIASFTNRASCERWPPEETALFYRALRAFGQNYSMIEQLFPNRNRKQIKNKFKKEERSNPALIEAALREHGARRHHLSLGRHTCATDTTLSDNSEHAVPEAGIGSSKATAERGQIFQGFDNDYIQRVFGAASPVLPEEIP